MHPYNADAAVPFHMQLSDARVPTTCVDAAGGANATLDSGDRSIGHGEIHFYTIRLGPSPYVHVEMLGIAEFTSVDLSTAVDFPLGAAEGNVGSEVRRRRCKLDPGA